MPHNTLPRVMKNSPTGTRNHGRPLKRLLDTWDQNGSTSGPTPWQTHEEDKLKPTSIIFQFHPVTLHCKWTLGSSNPIMISFYNK